MLVEANKFRKNNSKNNIKFKKNNSGKNNKFVREQQKIVELKDSCLINYETFLKQEI